MPDSTEPLIRLEPGGIAPVLRYDIPEPTSYEGKNFIRLEFDDDIFVEAANDMPSYPQDAQRLSAQSPEAIRMEVQSYLDTGVSERGELPNLVPGLSGRRLLDLVGRVDPGFEPPNPVPPPDDDGILDGLVTRIADGEKFVLTTGIDGSPGVESVPVPDGPDPHLYLVESLRLSSFLGDYGAGRIVKTFSLLPGEATRVSVKTFKQRESTRKSASSALDSLTSESAIDLEKSVRSEQSDQKSYQSTKEYFVEGEASASWGWGSAKVKAGAKSSTNAAREESVKNVANATEKHAARSSAKRSVEVNTSYEVTEKEGEETEISREIENINLSRTLNFVFRQMNQEFVTLLHLTDVRIGFFNGDGQARHEVPISSIDSLLDEVVEPDKREAVRDVILEQLGSVRNWQGAAVDVVKSVTVGPDDTYRVFDPDLVSSFEDHTGRTHEVKGVLLKTDRLVMRTEGVMVEALLGSASALDSYAEELQALEVDRRRAQVSRAVALAEQVDLVNRAIDTGDTAMAEIAGSLVPHFRCCNEEEVPEPDPDPITP